MIAGRIFRGGGGCGWLRARVSVGRHSGPMDLDVRARAQSLVVTRSQALDCGLTDHAITWRLASGRWQRVYRGVYLVHAGDLTWSARAWAAVLYAGPGAALGMLGAAHLLGMVDRPPPGLVVVVPGSRRVVDDPPRLRITRRSTMRIVRVRGLPVTGIEDTVLDLAGVPGTRRDAAVGHAARAVQRGLTSADRLAAALALRGRHPHGPALRLALGIVADGAESVLEVDFVRGVLRRHGLPAFRMQAPDTLAGADGGSPIRRDFVHEPCRLVVEVDGVLGHAGEGMWRDRRRDRRAARHGWLSLRAGWVDVRHAPCELAVDIAMTMRARGWLGTPRPCRPGCPVAGLPLPPQRDGELDGGLFR